MVYGLTERRGRLGSTAVSCLESPDTGSLWEENVVVENDFHSFINSLMSQIQQC
jgi:hypothetical protein